jgi:hypothetical protein
MAQVIQTYRQAARKLREVHPSRRVPMKKNLGMLLLGIWLILTGLIPLAHLSFSALGTIMAVLAIIAGALILIGK